MAHGFTKGFPIDTDPNMAADSDQLVPTQKAVRQHIASHPGPAGPDPWLEPVQDVSASGSLEIDYSLGKHVRLTLTGNVTAFTIINWPAMNRIARLTLEIVNTGAFDILAWPAAVKWMRGNVPIITQGAAARDRIILSTSDSGTVIYGDPVGFDYR